MSHPRPIKMSFYTALLSADGKTLKMLDPKGQTVAYLNFGKEIKFRQENNTPPETKTKKTKKDGENKNEKIAKDTSNSHRNPSQKDGNKVEQNKTKTSNFWKEQKT
jgi:hypothetical protein